MVLDSSAIVALIFREPGYEKLWQLVSQAQSLEVGAPTLLETHMVLSSRLGTDTRALLNQFVINLSVEIIPFSKLHFECASEAFLRFGKGRNPAALNFGDCMAYALAKLSSQPLLYVREEFSKTDIKSAFLPNN